MAVDKKMEYICIELSVDYGHLFFLVICVSIHNTTSMQTSFESMFMPCFKKRFKTMFNLD